MINVRAANQLDDLKNLLNIEGSISIAVAYVSADALKLIDSHLVGALNKGQQVRLILDLKSWATDPDAVDSLVKLSNVHPNFKVKTYAPTNNAGIFHPKVYIAHSIKNGFVTFLVGSHNLTGAALDRNIEYGLWAECDYAEELGQKTVEWFDELWEAKQAIKLDEEIASEYRCLRPTTKSVNMDGGAPAKWQKMLATLRTKSDTSFVWPSEDTAFLMGAICARGKLVKGRHRIEISLNFRPGQFTDGKIRVRNTAFDAVDAIDKITKRIEAEAKEAIPGAEISVERQKIIINCLTDRETFNTILRAYKGRLDSKRFSLPTHVNAKRSNKSLVRNFVRGYAVASGLIDDNTRQPGRGQSRPYVVWLRPLQVNRDMFQSLQSVVEDKLRVEATVRPEGEGRRPYAVTIPAEDFKREIGFGIEWWDDLVTAATDDA